MKRGRPVKRVFPAPVDCGRDRQLEMYAYILEVFEANGAPPHPRELSAAFCLPKSGKGSIYWFLGVLEGRGLIRVTDSQISLVGPETVEA